MEANATTGKIKLLTANEWLLVNENEFLSDFVVAGGSAARFVSGESEGIEAIRGSLEVTARDKGLQYVHFDPSELTEEGKKPDFHRIERFFFSRLSLH